MRTSRSRHQGRAGAALAAGVAALALAGCSGAPPAGSPGDHAVPKVRRLESAIVLEMVISRPRMPSLPPGKGWRGCPAGFAVLSGPDADPTQCYRRLGKPMTITYAAITAGPPVPGDYQLGVSLRARDRAALAAITTRALRHQLAIIVAGRAWSIPRVLQPLTMGLLSIEVVTRRQYEELLRLLGQPR